MRTFVVSDEMDARRAVADWMVANPNSTILIVSLSAPWAYRNAAEGRGGVAGKLFEMGEFAAQDNAGMTVTASNGCRLVAIGCDEKERFSGIGAAAIWYLHRHDWPSKRRPHLAAKTVQVVFETDQSVR